VTRNEKAVVVDELKTLLAEAKVAILADHRGLSVSELTELRRLLRQQGIALRVVKNTLARLATKGAELQDLEPHLVGPTAMVFAKGDPTLPAKLLASYAKTKPTFQIKAGFVEGKVLAKQEALALADLPPREVLIAKLAGVLQSPLRGLLISLRGPLQSLLMALEAVRQRKGQEGPPEP
jgi:large subunit ribosomal protein L10